MVIRGGLIHSLTRSALAALLTLGIGLSATSALHAQESSQENAARSGAESDQRSDSEEEQRSSEQESAEQEKKEADKEKAEKERAEKEKAKKDKAEKEKAEKEKAEQQKSEEQKAQEAQRRDEQRRQPAAERQGGDQSGVRITPEGWVTIGVDRDGDGRFELVESVFVYDLEVAQQRSRERQRSDGERRDGERRDGERRDGERRDGERRDGEHGEREDSQVDRRSSDDEGRQRLRNLRDRVSRLGQQARERLRSDGQTGDDQTHDQTREDQTRGDDRRDEQPWARVDRQRRQDRQAQGDRSDQRRRHEISGTVRELSQIEIPGHDEPFMFARIRNAEGRTGRVLLGQKDRLEGLELRQGDYLRVAGRPAMVNRQVVLVADRVEANGTTAHPQPNPGQGDREGRNSSSWRGERDGHMSGDSDRWSDRNASQRRRQTLDYAPSISGRQGPDYRDRQNDDRENDDRENADRRNDDRQEDRDQRDRE